MIFLIIVFPFFGFLISSLFGKFIGKGSCLVTTLNAFIACFLSCFFFVKSVYLGISYKYILISWIQSDILNVQWGFLFDSLTITMCVIITFVSFLVHLYSLEYMENDPHISRFMSYLSLFTFFMLILVSADNFLQMFVGWEGVGLSSYLLINFWFTRIQANKSAIKAMLVNRVGDFFILLGIFLIFFLFNNLNYDTIFLLSISSSKFIIYYNAYQISFLDLICFLLFFGAMGKSAQFGLHTWLPDAMEGPTPVSALIHAATMVTAGVFLIVRCSFLFELCPNVLNFMLFIGSTTAFFASTVGLFQNDIKKIIAYSTCSQLGYMVFACGLSSYHVAIFHLSNHAFFKALLFLGAGSIIHAIFDEQDLRKIGGLQTRLPFTYAVTIIGSLSLVGFPFMSGFYSKDCILELAFAKYTILGHFSYYFGLLGVISTALYSTKLVYMVFLSEPNGNKKTIISAHEPGIRMLIPLIVLSFFSIFGGFLTKDLMIGLGSSFFSDSIFILEENYISGDIEFISIWSKLMPFILTLFGIFFCYSVYSFYSLEFYKKKMSTSFNSIFTFFSKKWYIDRIYNELVAQNVLSIGFYFSYTEIDRGLLEQFGPFGIVQLIKESSLNLSKIKKGSIFHHLVLFQFGVIYIFLFFLLFYIMIDLMEIYIMFLLIAFFNADFLNFDLENV
jgi:proton-translocating NADH-quinone oxidoreductase chain L